MSEANSLIRYIVSNGGTASIDELRTHKDWSPTSLTTLCYGKTPLCRIKGDSVEVTSYGKSLVSSIGSTTHSTRNLQQTPFVGDTKFVDYAIKTRKNVLLEGPTGCGKTTLIESKAAEYSKNVWTINCDIELDKTELIGHYQIHDGSTEFVYGIVPTAMMNGDWIVFDEINFARQGVLSVLNQALDHRRKITIKEHENEVIVAHPEFRCFATMNPDYVGVLELNDALRRRFSIIISMRYLKPSDELNLILEETGINKDYASRLVGIGNTLRKLKRDGSISKDISTGHLKEMGYLIKYGFDPIESASVTLNVTEDMGESTDIMNVVKNYFKPTGSD